MRLLLIAVAGLSALVSLSGCRGAEAVAEDPLAAEAERILVEYLRVDTTNPPGNESRGAQLLLNVLRREGIEAKLVGDDPARQGVYARLAGGTAEKALLLLSHIDVVPANASEWTVAPFSGAKSGGYIWGRGALDAKSLTVAQMMAVIDLKRRGATLSRDVVFLAVPDEEGGGLKGAKAILERHADLFANVGYVLNEGGGNKTVVDRITSWGIEVDQKVPLWLEITTTGAGGHGSMPPGEATAIQKLLAILSDIETRAARERAEKAPSASGPAAAAEELLSRETVTITALRAGTIVNSHAARAKALIDCRVPPGTSPAPLLARIRETVGARGVVNVLIAGEPAPPSPVETPLFEVLRRELRRAERGSTVMPIVLSGTTDSRFFRARRIVAYGFSPFKLNFYDYGTIHGADEKIRVEFFREGVGVMRDVVAGFAASPRGGVRSR